MFLIPLPSKNEVARGLESWDWIDFSDLDPIAVSCFGDVFFQSPTAIVFLDTIEGTLTEICQTRDQLNQILDSEEDQDKFLLAGLVLSARAAGLVLEPGECYHFKVEPIIGGRVETANLMKMSFATGLHAAGQMHKQVKDMPVGTRITHVVLEDR